MLIEVRKFPRKDGIEVSPANFTVSVFTEALTVLDGSSCLVIETCVQGETSLVFTTSKQAIFSFYAIFLSIIPPLSVFLAFFSVFFRLFEVFILWFLFIYLLIFLSSKTFDIFASWKKKL